MKLDPYIGGATVRDFLRLVQRYSHLTHASNIYFLLWYCSWLFANWYLSCKHFSCFQLISVTNKTKAFYFFGGDARYRREEINGNLWNFKQISGLGCKVSILIWFNLVAPCWSEGFFLIKCLERLKESFLNFVNIRDFTLFDIYKLFSLWFLNLFNLEI